MQESVSTPNTPNRRTRRSYTTEFKRHIVSLCDREDKSIAQVALEHQINANLIHKWSRQFKGAAAQPMLPVTVSSTKVATAPSGQIDVLLGSTIIRFYGQVDKASAAAVLSALR